MNRELVSTWIRSRRITRKFAKSDSPVIDEQGRNRITPCQPTYTVYNPVQSRANLSVPFSRSPRYHRSTQPNQGSVIQDSSHQRPISQSLLVLARTSQVQRSIPSSPKMRIVLMRKISRHTNSLVQIALACATRRAPVCVSKVI